MPDSKPYCGIGKVPKGWHRGSMKECIENNQVRYYGLYKVDTRLYESLKKKKSSKGQNTESNLRKKRIVLKASIKTLARKFQEAKDRDTKKKIKEQAEKKNEELQKVNNELIKIEKKKKKEEEKQESKKKKGSKKNSSKKHSNKRMKRKKRYTRVG